MCPIHGEFTSEDEFRNHMLTVHPELLAPTDLMDRVSKPSDPPKPIHFDPPKPNKPEAPRKPIPVNLIYTYVGECPTCYSPVSTLMLDMPGKTAKLFAVAFCVKCNKQLEKHEVQPIE